VPDKPATNYKKQAIRNCHLGKHHLTGAVIPKAQKIPGLNSNGISKIYTNFIA
jgi:hypothetical protein